MLPVGVDLGFGDVKVVGPSGVRHRFPSRFAPHQVSSWGIGGNVLSLSLDGGESFVFGDSASVLPGVREPQGDGRLADPGTLALLAAALWNSGTGEDGKPASIVLGSGTPLGTFQQEADAARGALEGRAFRVTSSTGETRQFVIQRVVMRPQGVGAAMHLFAHGQLRRGSGLAVIPDIGSRTLDVLVIDLRTMEPVVPLCFSRQFGAGDAVAAVGQAIAAKTGFAPPNDIAHDALTRPVLWRGQRVGGREVAAPILAALANRITDALRSKLRESLDRVSALVPVGGGAVLIGQQVQALVPGAALQSPIPASDLPYLNAMGFQLVAERATKKTPAPAGV